jgi:hypothetical protein
MKKIFLLILKWFEITSILIGFQPPLLNFFVLVKPRTTDSLSWSPIYPNPARHLLNIFAEGFCWRLFGAPNTQEEPTAVLSGQARTVHSLGPDGPRPGAGARVSCLTAGRSARAQVRRKIAGGTWISLPGGTPSGRRDPRGCLDSGRPT